MADVRVRDGVMAMREAHRDWMDLQVVAFPQTGVTLAPWARPRWR